MVDPMEGGASGILCASGVLVLVFPQVSSQFRENAGLSKLTATMIWFTRGINFSVKKLYNCVITAASGLPAGLVGTAQHWAS